MKANSSVSVRYCNSACATLKKVRRGRVPCIVKVHFPIDTPNLFSLSLPTSRPCSSPIQCSPVVPASAAQSTLCSRTSLQSPYTLPSEPKASQKLRPDLAGETTPPPLLLCEQRSFPSPFST